MTSINLLWGNIRIRYGQDINTDREICTQVCIVGSGATGITLAWHLDQAGIDVIIIDGSRDYDQYLDIDCYQTNGYKKYLDKELQGRNKQLMYSKG